MHNIGGAHFQFVNNHYTKFEYEGTNNLELQISQSRHPKVLRTDGRPDKRRDLRTDGRNGSSSRPAFAKVTQVKMQVVNLDMFPESD